MWMPGDDGDSMRWTLFLCFCFALFGCDDSAPTPSLTPSGSDTPALCVGVSCGEWQRCEAGVCLAEDGRCDNYTRCGGDEYCGDDHRCHGPTKPGDDFFTALTGNSVSFEYRGVINAPEDAEEVSTIMKEAFQSFLGDGWTRRDDNEDNQQPRFHQNHQHECLVLAGPIHQEI